MNATKQADKTHQDIDNLVTKWDAIKQKLAPGVERKIIVRPVDPDNDMEWGGDAWEIVNLNPSPVLASQVLAVIAYDDSTDKMELYIERYDHGNYEQPPEWYYDNEAQIGGFTLAGFVHLYMEYVRISGAEYRSYE